MAKNTTFVDYYQLLGIADKAERSSEDEIREAIKTQYKKWRLRQGLPTLDRKQEAERRVDQIAEAERVLLDPGRRSEFDETRRNRRAEPTGTLEGDNRLEDALPADGSWMDRARDFMRQGKPGEALFAAQEALKLKESDHEAWSLRAHSALLLGRHSEADFSFKEAIRIKPNEALYHFDYGCALEDADDDEGALKSFRDAANLDTENPLYQMAIVDSLIALVRATEALPIIEEVAGRHPDNSVFQDILADTLANQHYEYATIVVDDWVTLTLKARETFLLPWNKIPKDRHLRRDGYTLTSEAQAQRLLNDMERAKKLAIDDPDIKREVDDLHAIASKALSKTWARRFGFVLVYIPRYKVYKREAKFDNVVQKEGI